MTPKDLALIDLEEAVAKAEWRGFTLAEIEGMLHEACVRHAPALAKGNVTHAARRLGAHRNSMQRYMNEYTLTKEQFRGVGEEDLEPTVENIMLQGGNVNGNTDRGI